MKKPIITIERQYGSGGSVIGNLVAEKLGINCYNRQILKMTAERCGIAVKNLENAEENVPQKSEENIKISAENIQELEGLKYEILKEDYPVYDLSFKIIIIGNSGKYLL